MKKDLNKHQLAGLKNHNRGKSKKLYKKNCKLKSCSKPFKTHHPNREYCCDECYLEKNKRLRSRGTKHDPAKFDTKNGIPWAWWVREDHVAKKPGDHSIEPAVVPATKVSSFVRL